MPSALYQLVKLGEGAATVNSTRTGSYRRTPSAVFACQAACARLGVSQPSTEPSRP
jgi:hypothetical protein